MSVEIVDSSQSIEDVKEDINEDIKEDVEKGRVNTFSLVPTSEEDVHDPADRKLKDISWTNVNFRVKNKVILNDCWGEAKSGEICAIMGPSGAGKSSLLNVLAGRSSSSSDVHVEGKIKVGGRSINPVTYRKNIAYVMQDDFLLATATPREALTFSAKLRLPSRFTPEQIKEKVEYLIKALGIEDCADTITGGILIKGISGGQRKRTSVGIELITEPTLLFLDEPTTGLDSFSALNLIKLLKKLANRCAILLTIHQPSSQIFYLFDVVVYMKEGRIFYHGSPNDILKTYAVKGYYCPENYNPSDFVMDLCQAESGKILEEKGLFMTIPERFQNNISIKDGSMKINEGDLIFHFESSFIKQFNELTYREVFNTFRDVHTIVFKYALTILMNMLYGLIFYKIGGSNYSNYDDFNSHFGALIMVMMFSLMGSAQSVLLAFPFERPMVMREYVTGTYGIPAYFLSKVALEIPIVFLQMVVAYCVSYFLMDLQGSFIYLVLISWGLGMSSCSIAMGLGCLVPNVKNVSELVPLAYIPQMLFAGFFIRTSQIPVFLRWAQYLCGIKYAVNLALLVEFRPSSSQCNVSAAARKNCENILRVNDVEAEDAYIYIILIFVLFIVFRILGAIVLYYKAKKFY